MQTSLIHYRENFFIKPLLQYHDAVCTTFKKNVSKSGAIVKKIGLVIIAPFAYLALAFVALIGLGLTPLLSRVKKPKNENLNPAKAMDLSSVKGDPYDRSSFVHEIAIGIDGVKFGQLKYQYSKFIAGPTIDNCTLTFHQIGDKEKMWSLKDSKSNNFSILMDRHGKFFAQVGEYHKPLQILINYL